MTDGEDDLYAVDAGDSGVRKLSALCLFELLIIVSGTFSFSLLELGYAPCMLSGVAGCDVNGPPPGVGGSAMDCLGDSGGGMLVPCVRS